MPAHFSQKSQNSFMIWNFHVLEFTLQWVMFVVCSFSTPFTPWTWYFLHRTIIIHFMCCDYWTCVFVTCKTHKDVEHLEKARTEKQLRKYGSLSAPIQQNDDWTIPIYIPVIWLSTINNFHHEEIFSTQQGSQCFAIMCFLVLTFSNQRIFRLHHFPTRSLDLRKC